MKILLDMNLSPEWVEIFARHGWEALHWSKAGDPGATDNTIMEWARVNGYIVFTHDLDFGTILATTRAGAKRYTGSHPGYYASKFGEQTDAYPRAI